MCPDRTGFDITPLPGRRAETGLIRPRSDGLMPRSLRPGWNAFTNLGYLPLIAVFVVPSLLGFSLLEAPLRHAQDFLDQLVLLMVS